MRTAVTTRSCHLTTKRIVPTHPPLTSSTYACVRSTLPHIRSFSTEPSPSTPIQLPKPTWSLTELNLTSSSQKDTSLPQAESPINLDELARRCLIDVHSLPPDRYQRLVSDLEDVMRCVSVITASNPPASSPPSDEGRTNVKKCPVRSQMHERTAWDNGDRVEASEVLRQLRGTKMVRRGEDGEDGGGWYFAINNGGTMDDDAVGGGSG